MLLKIVNKYIFQKFISVKNFSIGALKSVGNIRNIAMTSAFDVVNNTNFKTSFCIGLSRLFSIDFEVTLKRYIFEKNYFESETDLISKKLDMETHIDVFHFKNQYCKITIDFLTIIFLLPQFLYIYLYIKYKTKKNIVRNKIVCNISDISTHEMFSNIFSGWNNIYYCSEINNISALNGNIIKLGFPSENFYEWFIKSLKFSCLCIKNLLYIKNLDLNILYLFKIVFKGYSLTIHGDNNLFVTFEHLTQDRGIRNQFLKLNNSISVFLSKNTYVTYQQYPSEAYINYDLILASGQHLEEMLRGKKSLTKNYLIVGSYDAAVGLTSSLNKKSDICTKNQRIRIVLLATGICDDTYECELYLINLAKALSKSASFEISFRLKPVSVPLKYASFYDTILTDSKINVLRPNIGLFDSLLNVDIYISSLSTSAFDLSAAGAKILFINNTHPIDTYIPWVKFPQIFLSGFDLADDLSSEILEHRIYSALTNEEYKHLTNYVGYKVQKLDDYIFLVKKALEPYTAQLEIKL